MYFLPSASLLPQIHCHASSAGGVRVRRQVSIRCLSGVASDVGTLLLQHQVNGSLHVLHHVTWLHQARIQNQVSVTVEHHFCDATVLVTRQWRVWVVDPCAHLTTDRGSV